MEEQDTRDSCFRVVERDVNVPFKVAIENSPTTVVAWVTMWSQMLAFRDFKRQLHGMRTQSAIRKSGALLQDLVADHKDINTYLPVI